MYLPLRARGCLQGQFWERLRPPVGDQFLHPLQLYHYLYGGFNHAPVTPRRASCLPVTSCLVPGSFPIRCHHPTDNRGLTPTSEVGSSPGFQLALELLSINYQFAPTTYKMLSVTFVPRQKKKILPAWFLLSLPLKNSGGTILFSTFSSPHPPTVTHSVPSPLLVHHSTHPLAPFLGVRTPFSPLSFSHRLQ